MRKMGWLALSFVGLMWLAGCAVVTPAPSLPAESVEQFGTPLATLEPDEFEAIVGTQEAGEGVTMLLLQRAVADLAARLQVPESEIELISVDAVEWPDASLGCPEPGMMYAQVLTLGYRIEMQVEGESYWYHTEQSEYFVFCEDGVPSEPILRDDEPTVKDGDPNQPRDGDVIIKTPSKSK